MKISAATGEPIRFTTRWSRPKPEVSDEEHSERLRRVRSVDCPACNAAALHACKAGGVSCQARWDAYYAQAGVTSNA